MTILVADDDVYIREGIVASISWKDFEIDCVVQADNGGQALEIAEWLKPDIILTDVKMPRLDGMEFVERIMGMKPNTRIIFMSGYMEIKYLRNAIQLSAIDYIPKPVNLDILKAAIGKAVEQIRLEISKEKDYELAVIHRKQKYTIMLTLGEMEEKQLQETARVLNLNREAGEYFLVIIENDGTDILSELERIAAERGFYCSCGAKRRDCYIALLGREEQAVGGVLGVVQAFYEIGNVQRIGYSNQPERLQNLSASYDRAEAALDRSFFYPEKGIFIFEHEKTGNPQGVDFSLVEQFRTLVEHESGNIRDWLNALKEDICGGCYGKEQVKALYYSMLNVMIENHPDISRTLYLSHNVPLDSERLWAIIDKAANVNVLHNVVQEAVYICEQEQEEAAVSAIIRNVLRYVRIHYQDPALSIGEIAEYVHLSPTYLNVCFKKEMKTTLKQYIINVRLSRAKQLLKEKHLKMKDISEECGFADNGYFTKVFRKETGETPLAFRENFIK